MATWPSGTKASTANLDSGNDSPRLARPDIKQNVDNVNSIIDMFNIDSPTNNQLLIYNTSNSRFELGTSSVSPITFVGDDSTGTAVNTGETFKIAGATGITTAVSGDTVTITGTAQDFAFSSLTGTPTTISGYGITDAFDGAYSSLSGTPTIPSIGDLTITGSTISSPSNADLTLDPAGTGEVDINAIARFNIGYKEDINALTSSSTITVDCDLAPVHTVTLATNTGFVISNLGTGQSTTIIITQDGTGSRTATFGTDGSTAVKFPGGAPTLTTTAAGIDVVTIFNDGTNYLGNIAQAYA